MFVVAASACIAFVCPDRLSTFHPPHLAGKSINYSGYRLRSITLQSMALRAFPIGFSMKCFCRPLTRNRLSSPDFDCRLPATSFRRRYCHFFAQCTLFDFSPKRVGTPPFLPIILHYITWSNTQFAHIAQRNQSLFFWIIYSNRLGFCFFSG